MIRVRLIEFSFKEGQFGGVFDPPRKFLTFADAQHQLLLWASFAPLGGAYDKIDFRVTWADGETYTGRYDLVHSSVAMPSLQGHIRGSLEFYAGIARPAHLSDDTYRAFVNRDPETRAQAESFLATYALEDL